MKTKMNQSLTLFYSDTGTSFLIMTQTLGKPTEGMSKLSKQHEQLY